MVAMPQVNTLNLADRGRLVRDPVYQQLNELLQQLIRSSKFSPGQQFLTEREISERFGVSRVTANKALSHLVVAGVLEFRKGVGTFVRERLLDYDLQSLMSFTRRATLAGKKPQTRLLRFARLQGQDVDEPVRRALRLTDTDALYYFERLRLADKEPVILERRHLVGRLCPKLSKSDLRGSLYSVLTQKFGLPVNAAEQQIQAVSLSAADARLLRVRAGAPALRVQAVGYAGEPLWLEDTLYRADCYEFHNALGARRGQQPAGLVICAPRPTSKRQPR